MSKGRKDILIANLKKKIARLEADKGCEPSEKNQVKYHHNSWDKNLDEIIQTVKDCSGEREEGKAPSRSKSGWTWTKNWDCKYISIRIDMRDGAFVLVNRDGKRISKEQLEYQHNYKDEENGEDS